MSAQIIPFAFNDNLVRSVIIDGDPWFVGIDICRCLEIRNVSDAISRLDPDEKGVVTTDTLGGKQQVSVVSEPGVYRLVFTSRKAEAEQFKRWLAHEVLPQLRRTGRYVPEIEAEHDDREARVEQEALAVTTTTLSMVREARLIFGTERAKALWSLIGLPAMPATQPTGDDEPYRCLAATLDIVVEPGLTLRQALMNEAAGGARHAALADCARIIAWRGRDHLAIAVSAPVVNAGMAATNFPQDWARVLRRLPGAENAVARIGGNPKRCLVLPAHFLDEDNTAYAAA